MPLWTDGLPSWRCSLIVNSGLSWRVQLGLQNPTQHEAQREGAINARNLELVLTWTLPSLD